MEKNICLVGIGRWGKNLARNLYTIGALHTICDANQKMLDSHKGNFPETNFETNFEKILKNSAISRVVIAAPAFLHYKLAKDALLAGKDVYVEKPLCMDCDEAEELIAIAEKNERILMVGHLLQYHPYVTKIQEMVGSGELGKMQYIVSNRLNLGAIRTEENALWNFAPHDISVILSLCGHIVPYQVRCMGGAFVTKDIADTTLTTLKFENDIKAHIYVSWLNPFKEQKLVVVGSSGMIVFDDTKPWEEKLLLYRNHLKWSNGTIPLIDNTEPISVIVDKQEPLKEECLHFIKCCDERLTPKTDGKEGLRVLQVLQAAQSSLNLDGIAKNPNEKHIISKKSDDYFAHSTTCIDAGASIGKDSKIWHYTHVMNDSKIGEKCNIGQNVVVSPGVVLGNNVKVQNNVSIYSGVVCEDDVFLGPSMVFTNILNPRSAFPRRESYVTTKIKKGATIGANATILAGIELAQHCFIGAGAVVTKGTKPFSLMVGNPAKQIGWMSRFGNRIDLPLQAPHGQTPTCECQETGDIYQLDGDNLTLKFENSELVHSK